MLGRLPHDRPPMFQRLIRHPRTQAVLARLLAGYLAFVYRTTRWTVLGEERFPGVLVDGDGRPSGAIIAFWHERLSMMPMLWASAKRSARTLGLPGMAGRQVFVLISGHRDGRLISSVVKRLDLETVVGSTNAGARAAAMGLLRQLRQGNFIAITPDGPRGPRRHAAMGVAELGALAGVRIFPTAARTTRSRVFRSWDQAVLPLPFARGVLVLGEPILVPRGEATAALPGIEAALTAACDLADAWVAAQA